MDKTTKTIIIAGSSILVASVGIGVYLRIKNKPKDEESESLWDSVKEVVNSAVPKPTKCSQKIQTFPVKKGQQGEEVGQLQEFLNKFDDAKLTRDCHFGDKTQIALTNFARRKGYDDMLISVPAIKYKDLIVNSLRNDSLPSFWSPSTWNSSTW